MTDASIVTLDESGTLRAYDRDDGTLLAERGIPGANDLATIPWTERVVVDREMAGDPDAVAGRLASLLAADSAAYAAALGQGPRRVVLDAFLDATGREALVEAIDGGTLAGVSVWFL